MDIRMIDSNFIQHSVQGCDFHVYNLPDWMLEGFPWEKENKKRFCRLPDSILPKLNQPNEGAELISVEGLSEMSAGGVLRFCTDSNALLLQGNYRPFEFMPHMPLTGQAGFDVTVLENGRERLLSNLKPETQAISSKNFDFEFSCELCGTMNEYRIYLPLYAGLESLEIGLVPNSELKPAPPHKVSKPILFYGSSITQGGCASRPSNCHCALTARRLDAQQINLGFSGNAKGRTCVAEAIAKLPLSCFVMDYDHNAMTVERLQNTHEAFFQIIRKAQPKLPVVFVSRPQSIIGEYENTVKRRDVILNTYLRAKNNGDRYVYFVDGMSFFDEIDREAGTVDLLHPNDLGFYLMAKQIVPVVKEALEQMR